MVTLAIIAEIFVAALLLIAGISNCIGAEEFRKRMLAQSEKMRQPWRSNSVSTLVLRCRTLGVSDAEYRYRRYGDGR